ncbi:MAG TPA: toxin-antitoxin system HicB family antitoxin [Gaiellaceae bacterium]|nr:toxin-antitoxin system HicB family antitoxin [Gaiellaceae bacterium]
MNLTIVIDSLKDELTAVADLGDERASAIGRRLAETLGANLRLRLLDVLSQAALELSSNLPAGHVEVRLAGQEPELVYVEGESEPTGATEDLSARITLRLPDSLKGAVETAAAREGVSVNTWLVRAITRSVESRPRQAPGRRLSGWAQS